MKLNVEANVPQGSYVVVDKSEGQLKVMDDAATGWSPSSR